MEMDILSPSLTFLSPQFVTRRPRRSFTWTKVVGRSSAVDGIVSFVWFTGSCAFKRGSAIMTSLFSLSLNQSAWSNYQNCSQWLLWSKLHKKLILSPNVLNTEITKFSHKLNVLSLSALWLVDAMTSSINIDADWSIISHDHQDSRSCPSFSQWWMDGRSQINCLFTRC